MLQTALAQQIEAIDRQIDAQVNELYGLTEEEIGIVEGRGDEDKKAWPLRTKHQENVFKQDEAYFMEKRVVSVLEIVGR